MIEIKNASTSYVKGKKIIDKMNLKIEDGIVFGFIGPNGAGKTTTLEMITGVLQIDEGDIFIDGKSIKTKPIEAKKKFGFVPDSPEMFEKLTGLEYLNFIGDVYEVNPEERLEIVEKLAKKFNIYDSLKDRIQSYSHGMKQKLLIISVLLYNPKNWILDEHQRPVCLSPFLPDHVREGIAGGGVMIPLRIPSHSHIHFPPSCRLASITLQYPAPRHFAFFLPTIRPSPHNSRLLPPRPPAARQTPQRAVFPSSL